MLIMYCLIPILNGSNVSCASTSTIIDIMIEEDHWAVLVPPLARYAHVRNGGAV